MMYYPYFDFENENHDALILVTSVTCKFTTLYRIGLISHKRHWHQH